MKDFLRVRTAPVRGYDQRVTPRGSKTAPHARRQDETARRPAWEVVALAAAGAGIALYLAITKLMQTTPALCRAGGSCEIVQASQHGWQAPVFDVKADCDLNFEALTRRLLDARPAVRLAIASHNLRSVSHAIAYNRLSGGADADLEIQVLRGLGDPLQTAIARQGLRVRTYCPVGDLVAGMAYLVRRLLENTSNESFLHEQALGVELDELLAKPRASTAA